jgi:hypothetical protein
MQSTFPSAPSPLSKKETQSYYAGLPSHPVLVARTSTPWEEPTGPEAYSRPKELRVVGNHALKEVWEDNLALKVHAFLDSIKVKWTSTDVVRIRYADEPESAPVILWIGVMPASLSCSDGFFVAHKCRELLEEYGITDVDVEIRESVVTRSVGPKLLEPTKLTLTLKRTVDVREPLTATPGLPICAQSTPWVEGTGGFFMAEGGDSNRLFLITARHVVFTPDINANVRFEHKTVSQRRHNVILLGDAAFNKFVQSIQDEIREKWFTTQYLEDCVEAVEGRDDPASDERRKEDEDELKKERKAVERLNAFHQDVLKDWATSENRILGHVIFSPPINIGVGTEQYTEDFAIIEIDGSKIDASNFKGNVIDLGTQIPIGDFHRMMSPNAQDAHPFKYPYDRLLGVSGTIPDEEMRCPTTLDKNGDPCLMVIKRGNTTGLTIGRANDVYSYSRNYYDDDSPKTSKEWAILAFDCKSGPFSEKGDSGSLIVDGRGRIGGLINGGAGDTPDITYATPINFLLKRIHSHGFSKAHINPVLS